MPRRALLHKHGARPDIYLELERLSDAELLQQKAAWRAAGADYEALRRRLAGNVVDRAVSWAGLAVVVLGALGSLYPRLAAVSTYVVWAGVASTLIGLVWSHFRSNWRDSIIVMIDEATQAIQAIEHELDRRYRR